MVAAVNEYSSAALLGVCHRRSEVLFKPLIAKTAIRFAPFLNVPTHFLEQLFAVEDKRFALHIGVDPISIFRAGASDLIGEGVFQGASTITQQLYDVRRELNGGQRSRTLSRKLLQTVWAIAQEMHRSKCDILSEYLYKVYWGASYYGLDAAASGYLNSTRDRLTVAQGFFLAERLASPNAVSVKRVKTLLRRPCITTQFALGPSNFEELLILYDEHFGLGGELL